jgi:hypothetical protein
MLGFLLHAPRGPFYSPRAARSRWRSIWKAFLVFCRVVHRTVQCTTGQPLFMSGARSPSISGAADRCSSGPVGAPDTVRCAQPTVGARHASPADCAADCWPRAPLAHRTVQWILATSPFSFPETDEFVADDSPDSPVHHRTVRWFIAVQLRRLPRAAGSTSASLEHRTLSGAPPDSPVCQAELEFGCTQSRLFHCISSSLSPVSST